MLARLSSKGQVVIPKDVRQKMSLHRGIEFEVKIQDGQIILKPITNSPIDSLYGKFANVDLLSDLEQEHHTEVIDDEQLYA
ncbi:MAG: AbrB/MazE/SpoVT family DNA-binding domain-containing protein [Anaerolineales bacterium]|nr:AbrB/MazE/SpoVT family DNA-binding domain-containing protein [Anaerolineales bacterium]